MKSFALKDGMLIGSASAATQIEGGELDHSWIDWYRKGRIKDGSTPARANDHYHRWREDAQIMRELGLQIYHALHRFQAWQRRARACTRQRSWLGDLPSMGSWNVPES